jgi:hypothetical protein
MVEISLASRRVGNPTSLYTKAAKVRKGTARYAPATVPEGLYPVLVCSHFDLDQDRCHQVALSLVAIPLVSRAQRIRQRLAPQALPKGRLIDDPLRLAEAIMLNQPVAGHLFLSCHDVVHPAALATGEKPPVEQNGVGALGRFVLARCHGTIPFPHVSARR